MKERKDVNICNSFQFKVEAKLLVRVREFGGLSSPPRSAHLLYIYSWFDRLKILKLQTPSYQLANDTELLSK